MLAAHPSRSLLTLLALTSLARAEGQTRLSVAVFDVEVRDGAPVGEQLRKDLHAYLSAQALVQGFKVVVRTEANRHHYEACLTRACQRRSAKALGADRALVCEIAKRAGECAATALLIEIQRPAAEQVTAVGACSEEGLSRSLRAAVKKLTARPGAARPLPPEAPRPAPEPEPSPRTAAPDPPAKTGRLKLDSAARSIGPRRAPVKIEVFSDYQCPYCATLAQTLMALVRRYPAKIRLERRDYPLDSACNPALSAPMHPVACEAAYYARCAAAQGKFWELDALLLKEHRALDAGRLKDLAAQLKLHERKLAACLQSRKTRDAVAQDIKLARSRAVSATPTSFVNGQLVSGAQSLEAFERQVRSLLGLPAAP
jgi:protein-disulfide isomerase